MNNKSSNVTDHVYSPIALDLGAKNTGVYMAHRNAGGDFKTAGAVVCLSNDKITWMQKARTAKRHQRRGIKRKHLVRRLLWQILEGHYGLKYDDLPKATSEFVNGLLRRRGFTYLTPDDAPDPNDFADLELAPILEVFPALHDKIGNLLSVADLLREMGKDVTLAKDVLGNCTLEPKEAKKHFKHEVETGAAIGDSGAFADGFNAVRKTADATVKALEGGHKPRWDFFKNIEADILHEAEGLLAPVLDGAGIDDCAFARLVGNLSNLQLRVLRKYFNDPVGKTGDTFDDAKLKSCLHRWILSWHVAEEKSKNCRRKIGDALAASQTAVAWLLATPPEETIPPFEDQDNRRHPTDTTLLLDDGKLSRLFPCWRELADTLMNADENAMLLDHLDEICALQDRKASTEYLTALMLKDEEAKRTMAPFPSLADKRRMYFLARLFDRSKILDPYLCRTLARFGLEAMEARESASPEADGAFWRLHMALDGSPELLKTFLDLAKRYYEDIERAKGGLWFDSPETAFRVSGLNTPRKEKIKHILVGHLLGRSFTEEEWRTVETKLYVAKVGRTGFWRALEKIESVRKEYGNAFAEEYALAQRALARNAAQAKGGRGKDALPTGVDPDMAKAIAFAEDAPRIIAAQFGHDERQRQRYANPFTLAQLFIHVKGEVAGFSRSCEAVARENQWRNIMLATDDGCMAARCSRLASDSTRPFDGALARIIERQARRIADLKLVQIGTDIPPALDIPLFIEENAFTFTEGLNKVKTGIGAKGQLQKRLERLDKRQQGWADKDERIRRASCGICPYTGQDLGGAGEFDHIIPRSLTRKLSGTVFNHEANLIFCSNPGNVAKGDKVYGLENLDPRYLVARYGTTEVAAVKSMIRATLERLSRQRDIVFQTLSDEEQRDIRHALFMHGDREVFRQALDIVKTQIKTRVNGTQAYLAKKTCAFLEQELRRRRPDVAVTFRTIKAPAENVSDLRRSLAAADPATWGKPQPQPLASHVRDALLALVCGETGEERGLSNYSGDSDSSSAHREYANFLNGLFPQAIDILQQIRRDGCDLPRVSSRTILKDSLYQEHFVPVWAKDGHIQLGFAQDKLIKVKAKKEEAFFAAIRPFLRPGKNGILPAGTFREFVATPILCWPIDKAKAIAWLFEQEKTHAKDGAVTYHFLEDLRYTTRKVKVFETLFDRKVDYDNIRGFAKTHKIGCAEGAVTLPVHEAWARLEKTLRAAGVEDGCADPEKVAEAIRGFFSPQGGGELRHRRVRKVFSLPVPSIPSGGVRIMRKDWRGGEVIQLATCDFPSKGFRFSADGSVDFNSNVRHFGLAKSGNLSFLGDISIADNAVFEPFGAWREVKGSAHGKGETSAPVQLELPLGGDATQPDRNTVGQGVIRLALSPNSRDRMRVRCAVAWEILADALATTGLTRPNSAFGLMAELPSEVAAFCGLWKARSKLFVEQILPDSVTFSYIVESTSADMKERYKANFNAERP